MVEVVAECPLLIVVRKQALRLGPANRATGFVLLTPTDIFPVLSIQMLEVLHL